MPIQTQFPSGFNQKYVRYLLRDRFLTAVSAPLPSTRIATPGPGSLVKVTDSNNDASIAGGQLRIPSVVGDLDPSYYWRQADSNGFSRVNGRALVISAQGSPWVGWSNSITLATSSLLYGAKERSVIDAGTEYQQALTTGDPTHIIVLESTGAWHYCRHGTNEFRCWRYPSGNDAILWPAILGQTSNYDSIYVYDVTLPAVTSQLTTPAQGDPFSHPLSSFYFEVTVTTRSTNADTYISFARQDDDNRLFLVISPAGAVSLYKRVGGVQTTEKVIFGNGVITSGSRIIIQWSAPEQFVTTSGNRFKVWGGSSFYDSSLSAAAQTLLDASSSGLISIKPSNCTLTNLICASFT